MTGFREKFKQKVSRVFSRIKHHRNLDAMGCGSSSQKSAAVSPTPETTSSSPYDPSQSSLYKNSLENQVPKQPLLRFAPKSNGGIQGLASQDEYVDRDGDTANAFYLVNDKRAQEAAKACNSPLLADNTVRPKIRR